MSLLMQEISEPRFEEFQPAAQFGISATGNLADPSPIKIPDDTPTTNGFLDPGCQLFFQILELADLMSQKRQLLTSFDQLKFIHLQK